MAHPMIPLRIIAAQMGMMTGTAMGDMRANWMIIQHTIAVRLPAATGLRLVLLTLREAGACACGE